MASLVNTSTLAIVRSVNTPEFTAPWTVISEANAATWSAIPVRYRKWVTDHVEEMTAGEKTAVDAALLAASRDAVAAQLDSVEDVLRAFMLTVLDELNLHSDKINAILTAIDNGANIGAVKANVLAIADYPQRTAVQLRNTVRNKLGS
jgi:hypothetical protein